MSAWSSIVMIMCMGGTALDGLQKQVLEQYAELINSWLERIFPPQIHLLHSFPKGNPVHAFEPAFHR